MDSLRPSPPGASDALKGHLASSVWFPRARAVELRCEPLPAAGPDDIHVQTVVSGLSHGTEMLVYRGQIPAGLDLDLPALRGSFDFPIKYGYSSVGRVVETRPEVCDLRAGDLVFVHHPHQSEYIVPAMPRTGPAPLRLPGSIEPEIGVFTANLETAINVMLDAAPRLGERVVIFGQGVVGLLLTQLARRAGASLVVAVEPLPLRQNLSQIAGADVVLSPGDDLGAEVRQLTGGIGADLALEATGNPAALQPAIDCVASEGTIVVCSWYGAKPVTLGLGAAFHRHRIRIVSSQVGSIDPGLSPRWTHARRLALARDLLSELTLAPLITHRIPFTEAARAYALIDEHPEEVVQVILTYEDADV